MAREKCPQAEKHTSVPLGYMDWHFWAVEKGKTHRQVRCPGCARLAIWVPRRGALSGTEKAT